MGWGSALFSAAGFCMALPLLICVSFLLLIIAITTTGLAAFALSFRALFVYFELAISVATDYLTGRKLPATPNPGPVELLADVRSRSVRSVSSSNGSQTPQPTVATPIYANSLNPLDRDFEGIGGWRISGEDDNDSDNQWLTMNSRLELPAVSALPPEERKRHHHRHSTTGTLSSDKLSLLRHSGRNRPSSTMISGANSPETNLSGSSKVKSMTQIGDSLGLVARAKRARRSDSVSSSGSGKTLVI